MQTRIKESGSIFSSEKWRNIGLIAIAELLAISHWFSASSVVPQLTQEWNLSSGQASWLTMTVQAGFVFGALISAILNLADRVPPHRLMAASALVASVLNAAIALPFNDYGSAFLLRFLTGATLAGVYPPGMKLIATWCKEDRGLGIGVLIAALTLGSAMPHLLNGISIHGEFGMPPWRSVLLATSAMGMAAALLAVFFVRAGPLLDRIAPFDWRFVGRVLAHKPTRLANFGYLGHMWELYAMWTWVPLFLISSYESAEWSRQGARIAGFCAIGIGALGCVMAGVVADRRGRTEVTIWCLVISGLCALSAGFLFTHPGLLTALCLIWGISVVGDSAQFSTAVSELTDPRYVGTALTVQTSLGFLLTLLTIRIIPILGESLGWERVFAILAAGPLFGIWSMFNLRRLPEASQMASGNR